LNGNCILKLSLCAIIDPKIVIGQIRLRIFLQYVLPERLTIMPDLVSLIGEDRQSYDPHNKYNH